MGNRKLSLMHQAGGVTENSNVEFYRCKNETERQKLELLLESQAGIQVVDTIRLQLRDLVKLEHPDKRLSEEEYGSLIDERTGGEDDNYGVWVYYPWRRMVIHMLDEEEFVRVRTIRNAYKITPEEQKKLSGKKIGVAGLSVGQAAVMALIQERLCGEIRIADFDRLELSNLNRIRTGVLHLGLKKSTLVKREIAELDPYIKVVVFDEGITRENAAQFISGGGPLDLLVEECDSADVKILLRKLCRENGIPVLMETSDRGLLDIERFDLDRNYPILHGLIEERFLQKESFTPEEKMELLYQCFDVNKASPRMLQSLEEVGKTITTWPQLATDVILGGAVVATAARMIFLTNYIKSARIYVDVPSIIGQ